MKNQLIVWAMPALVLLPATLLASDLPASGGTVSGGTGQSNAPGHVSAAATSASSSTQVSLAGADLIVRNSNLDLGGQDGANPLQGDLTITNTGTVLHRLLKPLYLPVARLQISYPDNLALAPGESVSVHWQYDVHGAASGAQTVAVSVGSDDPLAPVLSQSWQFNYAPLATTQPLRSAVLATVNGSQEPVAGDPVVFGFEPSPDGAIGKFLNAWVKDSDSPLRLQEVQQDANGKLSGKVVIDTAAIIQGAPSHGETQVVGKTDTGSQSYFFIQWVVLDKK